MAIAANVHENHRASVSSEMFETTRSVTRPIPKYRKTRVNRAEAAFLSQPLKLAFPLEMSAVFRSCFGTNFTP